MLSCISYGIRLPYSCAESRFWNNLISIWTSHKEQTMSRGDQIFWTPGSLILIFRNLGATNGGRLDDTYVPVHAFHAAEILYLTHL
jgi:hypothetical protein